ncbi:MAG: PAS domain S-box protein, partial [Bacteroidota bacterium]|nr:PAS domain S-box protein [Bacteroidota bacterium]
MDQAGKVLYVSPTIEKLLGYDRRQFKALELSTIIDEDHVAELRKKYLDMIKTDGKSFTMQCKVLNRNGEWVWVEGTFANLLNHPSVRAVVCNFRNVTKRVLLKKQKDDFISIATHELKTPVTSIKAYAQILLKKFSKEGNDSAVNMIATMDGQLNKLISLIGDLLDVTKIEGGRLQLHEEFYEFNTLIKELAEELQRTT